MRRAVAGPEIERLIQLLARLPGLGPRSARRAALHLVKRREELMEPLAAAIADAHAKIEICSVCGNSIRATHAPFVPTPRAIRQFWSSSKMSRIYGHSSARELLAENITCSAARFRRSTASVPTIEFAALVERVRGSELKEVVLALNATVDGQTTAHYVTDLLRDADVKVTRLAYGVPVGGELDYLDEGTLSAAIRSRTPF